MELLAAVLDGGGGSGGKWDEARWRALRQAAMDGGLCPHPEARGLAWRFFLGVLPPSSSSDEEGEEDEEECARRLGAQRQQYAQWKEQLYPDFNKVSKEGDDDPLSALTATGGGDGGGNDADAADTSASGASSSSRGHHRHGSGGAWRRYYEGLELIEEIRRDLTRLYPSGVPEDHFIQPRTQEALLAVLFVWATLHKATAYRQGMHEILAVLLYALQQEKQPHSPAPSQSSPLMAVIADPAFLEADAFLLFDKLMLHLEPLYYVERPPARHHHPPTSSGSGPPTTEEEAPVIRLSKRIQGELLMVADPEVHDSLEELEVSPQLYGIKWTRLLFAREFSMPDVLRLWDFMLAAHHAEGQEEQEEEEEEEPLQGVIAAVAVAMIIAVRPALLTDDVSVALRRLMTYAPQQPQQSPQPPAPVDIGAITALAHGIHRRDWPAVHAARARFGGGGSRAPTPVALNPFTRTAMPSASPSPPPLQLQRPQQQPPQQPSQAATGAATVPSWLKGFGGGTNPTTLPRAPSPSSQQQPLGNNGNGGGGAGPLRLLGSSLGAVVDRASSTMHNIADLAFYRRDGSHPHAPHHHHAPQGSLGGSSSGASLWGQQQLEEERRRRRELAGELEAGVRALEEQLAAALPPSDDGAHAPVWEALWRVQAATNELLGGTGGGGVVPPTPANTLRVGALEEVEEAAAVAAAAAVDARVEEQELQPPEMKEERRKTAHAALSSLLDGDLRGSGAGRGGGGGGGGGAGLWGDSSASSKTGTLDPKLSELLS